MTTATTILDPSQYDLSNATTWAELYPQLRRLAKHLVYSFRVPCWKGQEEDIVEDIVQEIARRIIEYSERAERGEVAPIHSLEHMIVVIVRNYCIDLSRRDRRLVRTSTNDRSAEVHPDMDDPVTLAEMATENVYQEELFRQLALEIAKFPEKQRRALLIDLANLMQFGKQPTPLQAAFLAAGIQLQDYQQPLPDNLVERSRHIAILCVAYKRVAKLADLHKCPSLGYA